jgi:hypothetical protein
MPILRVLDSRRTFLALGPLALLVLASGCSDSNPAGAEGQAPPPGALTGDKMTEALQKAYGPSGRPPTGKVQPKK